MVQLDDFSAIPFLDGVSGVREYQHRARLRSRTGDAFVTVTPPVEGAEEYFRSRLGLGSPLGMVAEPTSQPLAVAAACGSLQMLDRLRALARERQLGIHPYMGIEAVWDLAAALGGDSETRVTVLAPPPPVTWIANDKALFEDLVVEALGAEWVVDGKRCRGAPELSSALVELADRHSRVALKRLRCASAMGNLVFESSGLLVRSRDQVTERVERFLEDTQWDGDEEVFAVAWEETDISPSTQWWIPVSGEGLPRLDGVYEQILQGETKVFVGSRPSRLPEQLHRRLERAGLSIAYLLQQLGYVGRCSFDHLVLGDPGFDPTLRFTECNGRWGGTSLPMSLVDRVFGVEPGAERDTRPTYRAQDLVLPELVGLPFLELLRRVGDQVFDHASGRGRFLFYNLGPLQEHGKVDVIAVGSTSREADWALETLLPELIRAG